MFKAISASTFYDIIGNDLDKGVQNDILFSKAFDKL